MIGLRTTLGGCNLEPGDFVWIDHPLLPTAQAKTDTTADLNEAIDVTETAWDVTDGTVFSTDSHYIVDREVVQVSTVSTDSITVSRAQCGSTAATHADAEDVYSLSTKWEVIRLRTTPGNAPDGNEIEVTCREV